MRHVWAVFNRYNEMTAAVFATEGLAQAWIKAQPSMQDAYRVRRWEVHGEQTCAWDGGRLIPVGPRSVCEQCFRDAVSASSIEGA